jgi:hypothetical protein
MAVAMTLLWTLDVPGEALNDPMPISARYISDEKHSRGTCEE